jgi:autotransporter-associated beta strand protein
VTKKGTGTFTLWNANTYTGPTTVNAGTLLVHGSTAAGSTILVAANATLGGLGFVGGVVTNSGTLAPGAGTVGTLTLNSNLVMQTGASLAWELGAATNDIIAVKGSLTLGANTTLKLYNAGYVGTLDGSYTLMTYTGADPSLGTWSIDYGATGWSNGKVKLDNVSNPKRVYLTKGSTQGTMVLIF